MSCQPNSTCCTGKETADKRSAEKDEVIQDVKEYYGKRIKTTDDLQTSVCTVGRKGLPKYLKDALSSVHDEVQAKYYGCGLIAPSALANCQVLDLGSGAGMDCFVLSKLVGEDGHVTGLDMTEEQLETARKYIDYHTKVFEYSRPNVDFVQGYIEQLTGAGLPESHYDIIVSNCVVNLSPDKRAVLREAYKVLKAGGEVFFSDVYADKDLPEEIRKHKDLWGECIAGALSWQDLNTFSKEVGFCVPRLVTSSNFIFKENKLTKIIEGYNFVSATYRLWKLPEDAEESPCTATYNGGIPHYETEFVFDYKYTFKPNEPKTVDSELAAILKSSRYNKYFTFSAATEKAPCCIKKDPFALASETGSSTGGCCS